MARILYAGADIREHPARADDDWTAERREKYLLRCDVVRPLSVDPSVWRRACGPRGEEAEPPLPWIGEDAVLERAKTWEDTAGWSVMAFGVVAKDAAAEACIAQVLGAAASLQARPTWDFVGFDVADNSISGLSNCAYDEGEVEELRGQWSPRLNENGLFVEVGDALAFCQLTEARVSEHAPFRVFGIWICMLSTGVAP